ncbi:MAG: SGNH/GDSL hydrolase family protein [Nitrospina sp.]|nr:SGNH/GDSL hydrolase family protein [Nitrospina sp.]
MSQVETQKLPLWKKALFLAIPIVMFLVIMEVVLRFTVPFQNVRALCFHPIMERDYCPGVTGAIKFGAVLEVNSAGMIDKEYPIARTPGAIRVAVLGDSFTAGEEVNMGKRFHELWEARLPETIKRPVEFLNFGVRGYGTWEQLQMFHLKAARYKPDWVVVNLFWGNDIADNINQFNAGAPNPLENDYPVDTLWSRVLVTRKNFNKWLWNHSALYQWIRTKYNMLEVRIKIWLRPEFQEQQERIKEAAELASQQKPASGTHPANTTMASARQNASLPAAKDAAIATAAPRIKLETDQPTVYDDMFFWESAGWQVTRKLLLKLNEEVKAAGSRLAVVHFPQNDQVLNYPTLPTQELDAFLQKNGIAFFDTFPVYKSMTQAELDATTLVREYGDNHFSEHGHVVYADMTEPFLAKILTR